MNIFEFEKMLNGRKVTMNRMLSGLTDYHVKMDDLKVLIRETYEECTNDFEEQCITEGFKEVFSNWMETIKGAA